MSQAEYFRSIVHARHSVRAFLPTLVPDHVVRAVLEDAQQSPSNCNTQPWDVHIVTGAKRDELSAALLKAFSERRFTLDHSFDQGAFYGDYAARSDAQGAAYGEAAGVARDDIAARMASAARNLLFFDAPQVALLFMPDFGDNVRVAADVGMYAQTFMLSLVAHGLGGAPQTMLGIFADEVRNVLQIDGSKKMLFGISFGYPDPVAKVNAFRMDRAPIEECVTFHR